MAKENLIRTAEFPYHVMGRTNNKEWFSVTMDECWTVFEQVLLEITQKFNAKIGSFVLMSNHFHMILWTPNENLDRIMNYFMHKTSFMINKKSNKINHVFGSRYKWCLIQTEEYLTHVYRYNYQNPLRVGLTQQVQDYRYSTLYNVSRNQTLLFPIFDNLIIELSMVPNKIAERLIWLNEIYNESQTKILKKGLRRFIFEYPKHKQYKPVISTLKFEK